jgi:hypothetical protein
MADDIQTQVEEITGVFEGRNGWYDVKVESGRRYSTKKANLVAQARELKGQSARVGFTTSQNGEYTNYRLESVEAASSGSGGSGGGGDRNRSIERQVAVKAAAEYAAAAGLSKDELVGLAEDLANFIAASPVDPEYPPED